MLASRPSIIAVTATLIAATFIDWFLLRSPHATAEAALAAFYAGEPGFECMQAEPLRRDGSKVVPLVIRDLPNKKMQRRRYAILFLGEGRYREALPVLEHILLDTTEIYYFRADALMSIFEIAPTHAQELASRIVPPSEDEHQFFERTIQAVTRGDLRVNHECSW